MVWVWFFFKETLRDGNWLTSYFKVVNLLTSLGDVDGSDQLEMETHWHLMWYPVCVAEP